MKRMTIQERAALPKIVKAVSRAEWPWWAQWLATKATLEDKGVGDVASRMIGDEKSDAFKSWFKATFNRDCGCNGRQERWNKLYPLNE